MDTSVRIPLHACIRRVPHQRACTPPGYEWIPGYLDQHGGQLTAYGRNWLLAKWEEPYRAALDTADREYQDCLLGGANQQPGSTSSGLQLRVASKLNARGTRRDGGSSNQGVATRLNVTFTRNGGGSKPCDPFDPNFDPDHPVYPVDPNAPPASVPRSVFWKSTAASYDLDALRQAMQPVNGNLNPANPLSLRDLRLDAEGVKGAVRIFGHSFLPIPSGVQVYDDLQTQLEVASIRLDFSTEWADNGAVLHQWSAIDSGDAYTDFYCYYLGCPWWVSPPPVFDWGLVPPGCLADLIIRALPTAITYVRVQAGTGEILDTLTLSIGNIGTIDSRPIVARHRLFNSPGTPHQVLPVVAVGPAALGQTVEVTVTLPDCIVGKVDLAPANIQDFSLFQSDGVIGVSIANGPTPNTVKLRLTLERKVYHWDRDVDIRFIPQGGVDVGYPPQGWWPHVILRVPVSWNGCDAFNPATDSQAQVAVAGWLVTDTYTASPRWLHQLQLRVVDYAPPCDAFDCLWGYMRLTWPNGTAQTQQIYCIPGDIELPRTFTVKLAGNAPPTVNVELTLYYEASNRRRNTSGTDFDYLSVPGPLHRQQTLTP